MSETSPFFQVMVDDMRKKRGLECENCKRLKSRLAELESAVDELILNYDGAIPGFLYDSVNKLRALREEGPK